MPRKPKRPCSYPGCPHLTDSRFCEEHQKAADAQYNKHQRDPGTRKLYGRRWQRARKHHLAEHPFCVQCEAENRLVPATEVDHIVPHKGDWQLFWDKSNWQSLCKPCHSRKTAKEDGRWG
ncbi:MAG: HNH endonuclease [Acidobacteriota bacterium]